MASLVTFGSLIASVRQRAGMENSTFVTDAEIRGYLNAGLADLYDLVVQARGQEAYRNSYTLTTVGNQALYALPSDFYQLTSVDIVIGGGDVITARPFMEEERNRFKWYPGWNLDMPVFYRLRAGNIEFIPLPSGAYTVTLNYVPAFTKFATDGTGDNLTFDSFNGWDEYAVWRAVADCLAKEESDTSHALGRAAELRTRIESLAAQRDAGHTERVHDVYSDYDTWGWGWR